MKRMDRKVIFVSHLVIPDDYINSLFYHSLGRPVDDYIDKKTYGGVR